MTNEPQTHPEPQAEPKWEKKISSLLKNPLHPGRDSSRRRFRMKRFRDRPKKELNLLHLLPNVLTSFNVACGAASIVYTVEGNYTIAAILIIVAAFFDLIDGKVARFVGASSPFGVQLDSLADVISFGVAPPVLIRAISYQGYHRLGLSLVLVYTLCTVLRLARYNVQSGQNQNKKRESFTGLPCPVPAVFLASFVWVCSEFSISLTEPILRSTLHVIVVCLACLMVSTIPYPDLASFKVEKKNVYQHNVTLALLMCVIVLIGKFFFLAATTVFIFTGPILALSHLFSKKEASQEQTTPADKEEISQAQP
ncbi:MAG: CDP-diacylglycerol--serine O-phosphatidyltransferase [bacterium]|jgi:CDP-diacylglycerol--serine O-phosphatidyltransferase|nr:CDP-diacylglycerol--serine O-phosphatidyltransferase [bacterium]